MIPAEQLSVALLKDEADLSGFSCGSSDLDEFLKQDACEYQKNRLAVTYLCSYLGHVAGYVTLAADSIKLDESERVRFSQSKARLHEFPGIKIARLAVREDLRRRGLGTLLARASLGKIVRIGKEVGCRFATVDAIPEAEPFYRSLGFVKNMHLQERGRSTASMRYDLLHHV